MFSTPNSLTALGMAALISGVVVTSPLAQQSTPSQTPPPSAPRSQTQERLQIKEDDIKAYAAAATEVRALNRKWVPRLQAAKQQEGEAEADKVRQQALSEMAGAVQAKGLSIEKYNQIYELAQVDPELQRRIVTEMDGRGQMDRPQ